jgi:hypothetical protein
MESAVIVVGTLVVLAVVLVRSDRKQKRPRRRREAALRAVADELGFTYAPQGDPFREEPFLEVTLTKASYRLSQAFYGYPHVLRGHGADGPVTVFDVWHGGGSHSGKPDASNPYKVTMAGFLIDGLDLPPLSISPERRSDRFTDAVLKPLRDAFGWRDIDFDAHPTFSDRYSLRSGDEDRARSLFSPELVAFWESLPADHRVTAEVSGRSVVVSREPKSLAERDGALPPTEYRAFIEEAESVVAAFRRAAAAAATPPAP